MPKRRYQPALFLLGFALIALSCSGEEPVQIDLNSTTPPTTESRDDVNAAERERLEQLARKQCIDDPTKDVGTVRIVDPTTNEVVSELVVDCAEVRGS